MPDECPHCGAGIIRCPSCGKDMTQVPLTPRDPVPSSLIPEVAAKSVDDMQWSNRTINCLKNDAIKTIGQIAAMSESEMLRIPNFGRKSLREIKESLYQRYGIVLRTTDFYPWR